MIRRVQALIILLAVLSSTLVLACSPVRDDTVVIYTSLDQSFSEPILRDFERATGIKVQAVYDVEAAKTTGLADWTIDD